YACKVLTPAPVRETRCMAVERDHRFGARCERLAIGRIGEIVGMLLAEALAIVRLVAAGQFPFEDASSLARQIDGEPFGDASAGGKDVAIEWNDLAAAGRSDCRAGFGGAYI